MTGFTGVRWEARAAEQLSRDLSAGAGPKPLFEAGMSWAAIAGTLKELESELAHIRKLIGEGWSGKSAAPMIHAITRLTTWVTETSEAAARHAVAAERQAVAHTVAVAAMPDADMITALAQLETALKAVVAPPSALIAGGIARLDEQAVGMKAQAARVMATYEQATTPVCKPAHPVPAPTHLVDRRAAQARAAAAAKALQDQAAATLSAQSALLAFAAATPTVLGAHRSEQYVSQTRRAEMRVDAVGVAPDVVVESTAVAGTPGAHTGFVPAAPVSAVGATASDHHPAVAVTSNHAAIREVAPSGEQTAAPQVIGVPEREGR